MILPPPVPAPQSFQFLVDPSASHTQHLRDAQAARGRVRTLLKSTRRAEAGRADWAGAAKATADYLPHLYAIMGSVEADHLLLKAEPVFSWRSTLSTSLMKKANMRIALPSLIYELAATLLAHALCLSNQASVLVATLGSYETSASVTTAALKIHDETVNTAAELLCRASGVLTHLSQDVIPEWEAVARERIKGRPLELSRDVVYALARLFEADANLLAIRRLLSRSLASSHSNTTPGPPLSSSHPSPSLVAKLHLHVYTLYDEARSLIKTASRLSDSTSGDEVIPDLRRYLSDGRGIALSLSYKWLGVDAGENGGREKGGDAIAWLKMAKSGLEEVRGKGKLGGMTMGNLKSRVGGKERQGKVGQELESVAAFLSAYSKVNDTVHFATIPSAAMLQPFVPAGRAAVSTKSWIPPPPAFTHDTVSPSHSLPPSPLMRVPDLAGLTLLGEDAGDSSDDEVESTRGQSGYYGSGSYW